MWKPLWCSGYSGCFSDVYKGFGVRSLLLHIFTCIKELSLNNYFTSLVRLVRVGNPFPLARSAFLLG